MRTGFRKSSWMWRSLPMAEEILDEAMLDDRQEEKLNREFNKDYQIITREDRLEKLLKTLLLILLAEDTRERGWWSL